MKLLKDLYKSHSGKVSDKWDIYLKEYEDKLNKYQQLPIKFFEIDSSGFGAANEPALTVSQFADVVSKLVKENPHLGFGLYSTGQFQAGVRVFDVA